MSARAFVCPHCNKPTSSEVSGAVVWDGYDEDSQVNPPVEWSLVQCGRCSHPVLQARENFGDGFDWDEPGIVYPAPVSRLSPSVPHPLRREFGEALTCFEAKAYSATLVMVRRTLEGTCEDQGLGKKSLAKSLEAMREKGIIEGTLGEWADALRFAGNQGAHYTGKAVPREQALDALDFCEALLDHVYVLRGRFQQFQQRIEDAK